MRRSVTFQPSARHFGRQGRNVTTYGVYVTIPINRVLPVDEAVARRAAALHVPDPAPFRDALIGATALVEGMTVVTRNVRDFERFEGIELVNPWG